MLNQNESSQIGHQKFVPRLICLILSQFVQATIINSGILRAVRILPSFLSCFRLLPPCHHHRRRGMGMLTQPIESSTKSPPLRRIAQVSVLALSLFMVAACSHSPRSNQDPPARLKSGPSGLQTWSVPGTYHWVVPRGDAGGMIQVQAVGGSGGGGNVGWVRPPSDGGAYTCSYEKDCAGAGGGGGGASSLTGHGHILVVAGGGGGGGGGGQSSG